MYIIVVWPLRHIQMYRISSQSRSAEAGVTEHEPKRPKCGEDGVAVPMRQKEEL